MKFFEGRWREVCPSCGWVDYRQLKASAGALVEREGQVLLVRRAIDPWKGDWYLPAGYLEVDEPPARGAERETYEETGLRVRASRLLQIYFFEDDPRGNGLLILYAADILDGELRGSQEGQELGFFSSENLPDAIAGAGHRRAVRAWLAGDFRLPVGEAHHAGC